MASALTLPIGLAQVQAAADVLMGVAVRTPLLEFAELNERCGGRVLLKAETLQHTGSFKFRGAYHKIASLSAAERARGVLAFSSGNHAQGVAAAAARLGLAATIVMPADAPAIKLRNTRALGAEVVTYDRWRDDREAIAADLAARTGAVTVKPFDDPWIMAGQGTAGLELAQQAQALGVLLDVGLAPCGGGGLMAGVGTALAALCPGIAMYAVEPADFDDTTRSLATGQRQSVAAGVRSICDALQSPTPGELTFAVNRARLQGGLTVTDAEVRSAMRFAFERLKLVVEPGGCVALAALLAGRIRLDGRTAGVVLSGGNVDPADYAAILAGSD